MMTTRYHTISNTSLIDQAGPPIISLNNTKASMAKIFQGTLTIIEEATKTDLLKMLKSPLYENFLKER